MSSKDEASHEHGPSVMKRGWMYCSCGRPCRKFIYPDIGPNAGKEVEVFRNGRQRVVDEGQGEGDQG